MPDTHQISPPLPARRPFERPALAAIAAGLLGLLLTLADADSNRQKGWFCAALALLIIGTLSWSWLKFGRQPTGVKQDGLWQRTSTNGGAAGWVMGLIITGFYIILYWFPDYLTHLIRPLDGFSQSLRSRPADQWFLYGTFYTLAVALMGGRALWKYRHSRYQVVRTLSVIFFQTGFAFILPGLLQLFQKPEFYFSYFWPLKYDYLFPSTVSYLTDNGQVLGVFMVFWGAAMSFIATPILTYFYGKRWYCSWVCGCGGLAETAGDPYRHLADKSRAAWRWEVRLIYPIFGLIMGITALLWLNAAMANSLLGSVSGKAAQWYGFFIGSIFSGVVGVGFYPIFGSRVWCRFGCPMAAYLGLLQKHFSRFRISTNGGQCISCGNCSNVCEMGIDVQQYAQRGAPIVRASCVGCGVCSTVCPRGVLNLENGPHEGRLTASTLIHADTLQILS